LILDTVVLCVKEISTPLTPSNITFTKFDRI
jgi:hypothetical protein